MAQAGLQRDRPALGKAGEHNATRGYAARFLAREQKFHALLRGAHAVLVFTPDGGIADVVPGAHHVAAVDAYRHHRRMREDVAHGNRECNFIGQGREVVAVGAQAVQPDDAGAGIGRGLDFYGFQRFCSQSY